MLARADIPGAHPAGHRLLGDPAVGNLGAVDDRVADHDRRGMDAVEHRVEIVALVPIRPGNADHGVDHAAAVRPEVGARLPGSGVDADEVAVAGAPEDSLIVLAVGPVRDTALAPRAGHRRRPFLVALRVEHPAGLACRGVDGDSLRQRRVEVEDAADHERRRLEPGGVGRVADPV